MGNESPASDGTEARRRKDRWERLARWVLRHGAALVLITFGLLLVAAAVWVVPDRQAVASTLIVFGGSSVFLGALLPLLEGGFAIGPQGLRGVLSKVDQEARGRGLSEEEVDKALRLAEDRAHDELAMLGAALSSKEFRDSFSVDAIAKVAIPQIAVRFENGRLVFANRGESPIYDVDIDRPLPEDAQLPVDVLPIRVLQPGQEFPVGLFVGGGPKQLPLLVTWREADGVERSARYSVSTF